MPQRIVLGFVAGAGCAGVLIVAASAFSHQGMMGAILTRPGDYVIWPMAFGGMAGAALAAIRTTP